MQANTVEAIMDAAEQRIREFGYHGFSFRELAADVGIKSASVHHHFPTKPMLAAAVARRYCERFDAAVARERAAGLNCATAWRDAFRRSLHEDGQMCLCGVLGAEAGGLPPDVVAEARRFFERGVESLATASGLSGAQARAAGLQTLATLEGAMLLARALGDTSAFDQAAANLG